MLLIAEGATDESFQQLQQVLRLPNDFNHLRQAYKQFQRLLLVNTTTVQLAVNQALFSDLNRPLENGYANILSYDYEADHIPINFQIPATAVQRINDHISYRTQGKIRDVIKPEDLLETQLLLISSIFFKGQWKVSHFTMFVDPSSKPNAISMFRSSAASIQLDTDTRSTILS